jgi:alpha-tubulin suppressor-like RCC1 family protein
MIASVFFLGIVLCAGCSDSTGPATAGLSLGQVDAGYFHTCGLTRAGATYCWGSNFAGLLGRADVDDSLTPVRASMDARLRTLDVGASSACGLTDDGTAWCWGHNDEGQLGDGSFVDRRLPFPLPDLPPLRSISVGHAHACAVGLDGTGYCWGDNIFGQLGRGTIGGKSGVPTAVAGGLAFDQLHAGFYASCGITTEGDALCWGWNLNGQLGNGTQASSGTPASVDGGHAFRSIFPGDRITCGVTTGGRVYCWGERRHGLMGASRMGDALAPEPVAGIPDLARVRVAMGSSTLSVARGYACGTALDGELLCWGDGVPSSGDAVGGYVPGLVRIGPSLGGGLPGTGAAHLCAVRTGGATLCGGGNFAGQLGDGTRQDRLALHPIG